MSIDFKYWALDAISTLRRTCKPAAITTLTISICLTLIGFAQILKDTLAYSVGKEAENAVYVAFVDENANDATVSEIKAKLIATTDLRNVQFVSKETAQQQFAKKISAPEINTLPSSVFRHRFTFEIDNTEEATKTVNQVASIPGVAKVSGNASVAEKISAIQNAITTVAASISLFLCVIAFALISNAAMLMIKSKEKETRIMRICGVSETYIIIPTIISCEILCFIAAGLAMLFQYISWNYLNFVVSNALSSFLSVPNFSLYTGKLALINFATAFALGIITGLLESRMRLPLRSGNNRSRLFHTAGSLALAVMIALQSAPLASAIKIDNVTPGATDTYDPTISWQKSLEDVEQERADKLKTLEELQSEIMTLDKERAYREVQIETAAEDISELRAALLVSQNKEIAQFAELKSVLRCMEETQSIGVWNVILDNDNAFDMISDMEQYDKILSYERGILEEYKIHREELGKLRYDLRVEENEYEEASRNLENQIAERQKKTEELQENLNALSATADALAETINTYRIDENVGDEDIIFRPLQQGEITGLLVSAREELTDMQEEYVETRLSALKSGLSLVGRVPYFWGGRSFSPGWNAEWGGPKQIQHAGNSRYPLGETFPYGLDCSGFVFWCALSAYGVDSWLSPVEWMADKGAKAIYSSSKKTDWSDKQPGDIVVNNPLTHIGFYVCTNSDGEELYLHCASGKGVILTTRAACNFCDAGSIF